MTAKEWLNRGRMLDVEINALKYERRKALEDAVRTTGASKQVKMKNGPDRDDRASRYVHYAMCVEEAQDRLVAVKDEILRVICQVENGPLRTLLLLRYVSMKTWTQVGDAMHYETRQIFRLHKKALAAVEKVLEERKAGDGNAE